MDYRRGAALRIVSDELWASVEKRFGVISELWQREGAAQGWQTDSNAKPISSRACSSVACAGEVLR